MIASIQRHVPAGALRFVRPQGGLYLWGRLGAGISPRALLDRTLAAGVAFIAGHAFYADPAGESELRLCFSSVTPEEGNEAIKRLALCIDQAVKTSHRAPASVTSALSNAV